MEKQLITTGTAARRLRVSSEAVRKFIREGKLNAVRTIEGQNILDAADVEKLAEQRAAGKADGAKEAAA